MTIENPYHEGERRIQALIGENEMADRNGRVIREEIIKGALGFIRAQRVAVLGSLGEEGRVWASIFLGNPGFLSAPDGRTLVINTEQATFLPRDPFWKNIEKDPRIGLLLIEFSTRRRLRINGSLTKKHGGILELSVAESYPNCPKYIQGREVTVDLEHPHHNLSPNFQGVELEGRHIDLIKDSDTFFVASAHPERGLDASHRGGYPGFVEVQDSRTLRIPDYAGNSMFNTLGNFAVHPHAGLLFMDYARQRALQMVGRPEIVLDPGGPEEWTGGTRRYWTFEVERWLELPFPHRVESSFIDYSPHNPRFDSMISTPSETAPG